MITPALSLPAKKQSASAEGFQSVAEITSSLKLPPPGANHSAFATPKITITKRNLKRVEAICLIREQRDAGNQELAYNARPFVLCGIPLRRPPRDQLAYIRRNGNFFLEITGHPRFGLPYGQDRLIPIWIATLALQQNSRLVRFRSASQMLEFFHLTKDGRHYRRIVEGFQRVFAATIFFGTDDQPGRNQMTDCSRFHFFERMRLWFSDADPATQNSGGNTITLSDAFFRECNEHRSRSSARLSRPWQTRPDCLISTFGLSGKAGVCEAARHAFHFWDLEV